MTVVGGGETEESMATPSPTYLWPSRQEWARQRRSLPRLASIDVRISEQAWDYATLDEIANTVVELLHQKHELKARSTTRTASFESVKIQWRCRDINACIFALRRGQVPPSWLRVPNLVSNRYELALHAARSERALELALVPIDDAAWELELERRRQAEGLSAYRW
jgi:hypothetical protein